MQDAAYVKVGCYPAGELVNREEELRWLAKGWEGDRAGVLIGEAKWAERVDGRRLHWELERIARVAEGSP